ncbi:hypothetical protein DY000_02014796 [Brassica cretica]|uniref:Uncharacterized protein n=1 Tax=Brassica cretica TaxID=69181 RepID=A0ABQ7D756_BRACR|nr:hypothetical protein DY000_02014796 [Brassica cretica]
MHRYSARRFALETKSDSNNDFLAELNSYQKEFIARDLRPSQLNPETRSQPARDRRLDTACDNSLFPFVIRRSQLQLAFPIPARTDRDTFQL